MAEHAQQKNNLRHILSLSGGKDSTALAIYMKDRVPEMEYVFCDTQKELPETYDYLGKLEAYIGKSIIRLNASRGFDHWLDIFGNYLPSARMRWCTKQLKIIPFETYVGNSQVVNYMGIRSDEEREGYISSRPNLVARYPFKEDGITKAKVFRILEEAGLGLPDYYWWRSRSGCYFCFFQRKIEWVGLLENHPDLFEKAKKYEKVDARTRRRYTWQQGESLEELSRPTRIEEIRKNSPENSIRRRDTLGAILCEDNEDDSDRACLICDL